MGNEVGREPEGGGQQRSVLRGNFLRLGWADGAAGSIVVEDGDGDGERRRFRDLYMLQGRIGESGSECRLWPRVEMCRA